MTTGEQRIPTATELAGILTAEYGAPVAVSDATRIDPWFVLRCRLHSAAPDVPDTAIVKWLRHNGENWRIDPAQLVTEQIALQFLAERTPGLAPRLLAADLTQAGPGVVVIEDLAPREPLRERLLRSGIDRSMDALTGFATALGRLHSATIGLADAYYRRRLAAGPAEIGFSRAQTMDGCVAGVEHMSAAGVPMSAAAARELAGVLAEFSAPGPFLAFSNGDAQVNNYLVDDAGDGRFIDFEMAGYQHAMADLVALYVPGPMWMTVNDPVTNGLEAAYRDATAAAIPAVTDDALFGPAIAGAGFVWATRRLATLPTMDAREPGDGSRPHRIATLEAAADTATRHGALPHLAGWARAAAAVLRRRWPDAEVDFSALPAYTSRW
jgi:Phosphotransferase enzyme family